MFYFFFSQLQQYLEQLLHHCGPYLGLGMDEYGFFCVFSWTTTTQAINVNISTSVIVEMILKHHSFH